MIGLRKVFDTEIGRKVKFLFKLRFEVIKKTSLLSMACLHGELFPPEASPSRS